MVCDWKIVKIVLVFFICTSFCYAEGLYKWTDKNGVTHYSTEKSNDQAESADLPKIMKADVKIPKKMLLNCEDRGGIDCDAGADADGSVICKDGFREAAGRFLYNCRTVKLVLTEISDLNDEGNFLVYVRNKKTVAAKKVIVSYVTKAGEKVPLEGPDRVGSYTLAEYVLPGIYMIDGGAKPEKASIEIACENCP